MVYICVHIHILIYVYINTIILLLISYFCLHDFFQPVVSFAIIPIKLQKHLNVPEKNKKLDISNLMRCQMGSIVLHVQVGPFCPIGFEQEL